MAGAGTTVVAGSLPSDIDSFWFAVKDGAAIRPFDFVSVKSMGTKIIGIVDDLKVIPGPPAAKGGRGGGGKTAIAEKEYAYSEEGTVVAKAAILASSPQPSMPVMPGRKVRMADSDEVALALGIPEMANPIPAGVIEMAGRGGKGGKYVPVSLDISYIAGPDTAHVNVSGISGNRKTSYLLFLLQSAYQKLAGDVSIVIFNTKEQELLQLDVKDEPAREDARMFELMGLAAEPFSNVTYFLPRGSDGKANSALVPRNSRAYSFELGDVYDRLDLLFSNTADPWYDGIAAMTSYIAESWPLEGVSTWSDLARFSRYPDYGAAAHGRPTMTTTTTTAAAATAHFNAYLQRFRRSTLFVDRRKTSVYLGSEVRRIRPGDVYVIDIAMLPTLEEQSLVVGDVMRAIDEAHAAAAAKRNDGGKGRPKYTIIFIDEINRFLPRPVPGRMMPATSEQIMRTVMAGKSRGTVLFSAQQFKSAVDGALHDNTGTHVFAKLGSTELAGPAYDMIDASVKRNIVRLNKGEVVLAHPAFRHPIKITFPRASFKKP